MMCCSALLITYHEILITYYEILITYIKLWLGYSEYWDKRLTMCTRFGSTFCKASLMLRPSRHEKSRSPQLFNLIPSPKYVLQCIVLAKGKGAHREVGSERSRQQTFEPTNRNCIEGGLTWVMLQYKPEWRLWMGGRAGSGNLLRSGEPRQVNVDTG